jgi:ribosome-binding factor A
MRSLRIEKAAGRKALQLCGQVRDALLTILPGCGDGVLRDLTAIHVEPAPNTGRLRVYLRLPEGGPEPALAAKQLGRAVGMLRAEVAAAINRRHAPDLVFELM